MPEDLELLRRYASDESEEAFAELVRRHVDLVYSVALRHVGGDTHLAEDVAQSVFTTLARKAASLTNRPVLAGWLYRSTQFAAIDVVRSEARRRLREREAQSMPEFSTERNHETDWEKLRPLLARAIGELSEHDRDAVVLRFFNGYSFAQVGAKLRMTENAARMRVQRALDKLHAGLARHGCTSTTAAVATLLASSAGGAAPAGLAASVTGAALSGAAAGSAAAGWATFMTVSKVQIGIAAVVAAAGVGGYALQAQGNARLRAELAALAAQNAALGAIRQEVKHLAATAVEAAELRGDDAELIRLADQAAQLKARLQADANTQAQKASQGTASPWTTNQPVYTVNQLDQPPRPTFEARPQYPLSLRRVGVEGKATVSFVIDVNGQPRDVKVTTATHPDFGDAAVQAVEKWKFRPGQKDGRTVNTRIAVPIVFTLNTGSEPAPVYPDWF